MKPRVKKIPRNGLRVHQRYADEGDLIQYWTILPIGSTKSAFAFVRKVRRNKYGRISYEIDGGKQVMTEELTPLKHQGVLDSFSEKTK